MFCFGFAVFIFLVECFVLEWASLYSYLNILLGVGVLIFLVDCFILELASLCSWFIILFGIGFFMFLVDCFVLELAYLYSWLNVLSWSCRLYIPSWLFCFGVGIFMFLVVCLFWICGIYVTTSGSDWIGSCKSYIHGHDVHQVLQKEVFMLLVECCCFFELAPLCS